MTAQAGTLIHRDLHDGRRLAVVPLLFGARLTLGRTDDPSGYYDGW